MMKAQFTGLQKKILFVAGITNFFLIVDFMLLIPLAPTFMQEFNVDANRFSALVGAYTLAAGLCGLIAAPFSDRFGRFSLLKILITGFVLGNFLCGFSRDIASLTLARAFTGAFSGIISATLNAMICDEVPAGKRGLAFGLVMTSFALASIVGVPILIYLVNATHWQWGFHAIGLSVATLLIGLLIVKLPAKARSHSAKLPPLFTRELLLPAIVLFFLIMGHFSIIPFLYPSLVLNQGLTKEQLPTVYLVSGLFSVLATVFSGKVADFYGKRRALIGFTALSLAAIGFVTVVNLSTPGSVASQTFWVSLFFVCMSFRMTPAMALISLLGDERRKAGTMSLMVSIQHLSAAGAAGVAGAIVIKTDNQLLNFPQLGIFAITMSFIALLLSFKLRDRTAASNS